MGRALFSRNFNQECTVRVVPDPDLGPYSKWSVWNAFDPDSDEFFRDAEYEAFIEPDHLTTSAVLAVDPTLPPLDDGDSSSSSSEGSEADITSPMAVGLDDPATLIATAYPSWAASEGLVADNAREVEEEEEATTPTLPHEVPSLLPEESTAYGSSTPLPVLSSRHTRTMSIDSTSDAAFAGSPPLSSSFISTPSPATSVSPLLYNWRRYIAASPTPSREPAGPLTNPSARMSLTRIPSVPRVRIQGFTV